MIEKLRHTKQMTDSTHRGVLLKINELVESINALIELVRIDHRMVTEVCEKRNMFNITGLSDKAKEILKYDD